MKNRWKGKNGEKLWYDWWMRKWRWKREKENSWENDYGKNEKDETGNGRIIDKLIMIRMKE